eukprot:TRINITY_DN7603_c0_g2_i1.p2 TRINITY_DN7603_c0_g2~~TRINITY_DN7603_c0_g2_i1.p2  ORF type:complete len:255 (-),score=95.29 TRINITY_DN7603_c0_g2_i1:209-973(-)
MGGLYPYLDVAGGVLFTLGSVCFVVAPLLELTRSAPVEAVDWIYMSGVILLTFAKVFVEGRAVYAHVFKSRSAQVSAEYHVAIVCFVVGGALFALSLALQLARLSALWVAVAALLSSLFFLAGSQAFVHDSWGHVRKDRFVQRESNAYLVGSFSFWEGSAFFTVAACFALAEVYRPPLWPPVTGVANLLGGVCFLCGSLTFMLLGYWEMASFRERRHVPHVRRRFEKFVQREACHIERAVQDSITHTTAHHATI